MRQAVRAIIVRDGHLLVIHRNKFGQEYYTLPGGGIDPGETAEHALLREIHEETTLSAVNPRLVIVEDSGDPYGMQYIYLCQYACLIMILLYAYVEYGTSTLYVLFPLTCKTC